GVYDPWVTIHAAKDKRHKAAITISAVEDSSPTIRETTEFKIRRALLTSDLPFDEFQIEFKDDGETCELLFHSGLLKEDATNEK
nr:hypothetical protein [Gammaproteobacteria bacterium]